MNITTHRDIGVSFLQLGGTPMQVAQYCLQCSEIAQTCLPQQIAQIVVLGKPSGNAYQASKPNSRQIVDREPKASLSHGKARGDLSEKMVLAVANNTHVVEDRSKATADQEVGKQYEKNELFPVHVLPKPEGMLS